MRLVKSLVPFMNGDRDREPLAKRSTNAGGACGDRSARRSGVDHVQFPPASIAHIRAGKLRALAVIAANRLRALLDIPTDRR